MPDTRRRDDDRSASLICRSPALRLALAVIPLGMTVFVLISNVGWTIKLVIAVALGASLAAPAGGLLLVAAFAPMGELTAQAIGAPTFRITEAIVVAFLGAWLVRAVPDHRGPRVAAPTAGWLFAAAILASIGGLAWQLSRDPSDLSDMLDRLAHIYFFVVDRIGAVDGARLLEGMGLAAATVVLFRRHPALSRQLPMALAAGAAMAALSSVLLWRGIGTASAMQRYKLIGYRVSAHVGDVNAAGSYFAMILCLALGMAMRERGQRRVLWIALAGASGVGVWLSDSRSALGAAGAIIVVAAMWAATSRYSTGARAVTLAVVIIALLGGAAVRGRRLQSDPGYRGVDFREQFNATSLRMIGARPLFGVGIGQYYSVSPLFLSPQLAWSYGFENAHNYFFQVAAELGVAGFALFLVWLGAAFVRGGLALARAPRDARLLGVAGGAAVFLVTCATGHPFLLGAVAYPFWIQFGLMTALAGSTLLNHGVRAAPRARPLLAAAVALVILAGGSVLTANGVREPYESRAVNGLYGWETLEDGTRFRWTGAYASVFVPADVTRVYIPVRLPSNGGTARPMGIEVMTAGMRKGRTMVGDAWAIVDVKLPDAVPPARFKRIDLKVDRTWQPAVYLAGSADLRFVGVQIGELQLLRE